MLIRIIVRFWKEVGLAVEKNNQQVVFDPLNFTLILKLSIVIMPHDLDTCLNHVSLQTALAGQLRPHRIHREIYRVGHHGATMTTDTYIFE